nr:hypothetical protein 1634Bnrm2_p077 [Cryptomonas sp.]
MFEEKKISIRFFFLISITIDSIFRRMRLNKFKGILISFLCIHLLSLSLHTLIIMPDENKNKKIKMTSILYSDGTFLLSFSSFQFHFFCHFMKFKKFYISKKNLKSFHIVKGMRDQMVLIRTLCHVIMVMRNFLFYEQKLSYYWKILGFFQLIVGIELSLYIFYLLGYIFYFENFHLFSITVHFLFFLSFLIETRKPIYKFRIILSILEKLYDLKYKSLIKKKLLLHTVFLLMFLLFCFLISFTKNSLI